VTTGVSAPPEAIWQKLHPLTPVVFATRAVPPLLIGLLTDRGNGHIAQYAWLGLAALFTLSGAIKWIVTRWRLEGDILQIETGLLRRDSRQLPCSRIQAVDVVKPLLARYLGLAELRVRLAGSSRTDGRLAYLAAVSADELRTRLLLEHRPQAQRVVMEPPARHLAAVPTGRLAGSVLLSGVGLWSAALCGLSALSARTLIAAATGFVLYAAIGWRRFSAEWRFVLSAGHDGLMIQRGLLETVHETIPLARVQAVRQIEPFLWRLFGWCRLEVDIAGARDRRQRGAQSGKVTKALLPVGARATAAELVELLMGPPLEMSPPPRRALYKSPLSFHFLRAGHDATRAAGVTGRIRKVTSWVPLEKAQSIRTVEGPLQRLLGLGTLHIDAAGQRGNRARVAFRDRSRVEIESMVIQLPEMSRRARREEHRRWSGAFSAPPGWFPDPGDPGQLRYWDGTDWTAHVGPLPTFRAEVEQH